MCAIAAMIFSLATREQCGAMCAKGAQYRDQAGRCAKGWKVKWKYLTEIIEGLQRRFFS
jgi:hypothetical protein